MALMSKPACAQARSALQLELRDCVRVPDLAAEGCCKADCCQPGGERQDAERLDADLPTSAQR